MAATNHVDESGLMVIHTPENKTGPSGKRRRFRRSLKVLPNLFTLGNAFFGFSSIVFSAHGQYEAAAYWILLGASFDALDGRIARLTNNTSPLGLQLDSLADAVTFCLAPAFMIYMMTHAGMGFLAFIASSIYVLAGVFRLARFNVIHQTQSRYFMGLPSTIAGCFTATITLYVLKTPLFIPLPCLMAVLGFLMVSKIKFPTFKNVRKGIIVTAFLFAGVIAATFGLHRILVGIFLLYLAGGTIFSFTTKFNRTPLQ